MEENNIDTGLKERLILASLRELEQRGAKDFSLRRVALTAGVSCAAPYRHFKDKEELISATVDYVNSGWQLLCQEISNAYSDKRTKVIETAKAAIKFFVVNTDFRAVFFYGLKGQSEKSVLLDFDLPLVRAIDGYLKEKGLNAQEQKELSYNIISRFYGTLMLVLSNSISSDEAIFLLDKALKKEMY